MTVHLSGCFLLWFTIKPQKIPLYLNMFPNVTYKISNCCTVTCRQFPNLTFAPRKTCHQGSNLTLHSYQCHSSCYYTPTQKVLQAFFQFFTTFFIFLQNAQKASFLYDAFSDFYLIPFLYFLVLQYHILTAATYYSSAVSFSLLSLTASSYFASISL